MRGGIKGAPVPSAGKGCARDARADFALCCDDGLPQPCGGPPPMRSILAVYRARWKRLTPLTRDVTLVLVLKVTGLGILWLLFFSAPLAQHMRLVPDRVAERLMSQPPPAGETDAHR